MTLTIATAWTAGDVAEISPRGEVDVDNAYEIRDAVVGVLTATKPRRVELNLSAVTFIDSVGISALVAGFQAAEVSGVKLVITKPSRFVHRQLWATGLLGLFGAPAPYEPTGFTAPVQSRSSVDVPWPVG
ncbi:MAG TPA: STAS domain-containing protein [Micromonosporaceae bacterium]|nr:STAS domain-containing protein [Micromonosporaceae bacterium]